MEAQGPGSDATVGRHPPGRDAPYPVSKDDAHLSIGFSRRCFVTWLALFTAGLLEMVWALALKESHGFSKLGPSLLFLVAIAGSMVLLALALRNLPVGTGYAVWTGIGAVGTAIAGIVLFNEAAAPGRIIPIALIAVGIVWLALAE